MKKAFYIFVAALSTIACTKEWPWADNTKPFVGKSDKDGCYELFISIDGLTDDNGNSAGEAIETKAAIGELMCFEVPSGDHVIDMRYTPEGTYAGIVTSIIGLILFFGRITVINLHNEKCMLKEKLFKRSKLQKIAK